MGLTFEEIRKHCLQEGILFEDPDFPAVDKSIFFSRRPPKPIEWKRPKEICSDPQFIVDGASRFDISQGMLGDCWLLAAVASLTKAPGLFAKVVPQDQDFKNNYTGTFRFCFWQYGEWIDVVVDDRLPTYNGKLVFLHSAEKNEFWSALLEKAYAKLSGSYESLKGGQTSEAMTDFTGGITEAFDTGKDSAKLLQVMLKTIRHNTLMCCSIGAKPNEIEAKGPSGLIKGHAYSVTAVRMVSVRSRQGGNKITLVRIRNPWGNEREWTGAWSDQSQEWQALSEDERRDLGLTFEDDGEFWMSFEDFSTHFTRVEICNLGPDALECDGASAKLNWKSRLFLGCWQRESAGGCRNYINTFAMNPQYRVEVVDADEDEDNLGTIIVALMQKDRREMKTLGAPNLTIGYSIYKVEEQGDGFLDRDFFMYHQSVSRCPSFINSREVIGRHKLPPGKYCIVPSTFKPQERGDFILRVFSEKAIDARELNEVTEMQVPEVANRDVELDAKKLEVFRMVAGADEEVDAYELQKILETALKEFDCGVISVEVCKSIIMKMTKGSSNKLGPREFIEMLYELRTFKSVFKKYDADNSNHMNFYELREALRSCGFRLSNSVLTSLVMWYTNKDDQIYFDDFLLCIFRLKRLFGLFNDAKTGSRADFSLDEFVQSMVFL